MDTSSLFGQVCLIPNNITVGFQFLIKVENFKLWLIRAKIGNASSICELRKIENPVAYFLKKRTFQNLAHR